MLIMVCCVFQFYLRFYWNGSLLMQISVRSIIGSSNPSSWCEGHFFTFKSCEFDVKKDWSNKECDWAYGSFKSSLNPKTFEDCFRWSSHSLISCNAQRLSFKLRLAFIFAKATIASTCCSSPSAWLWRAVHTFSSPGRHRASHGVTERHRHLTSSHHRN